MTTHRFPTDKALAAFLLDTFQTRLRVNTEWNEYHATMPSGFVVSLDRAHDRDDRALAREDVADTVADIARNAGL